MCKKNGRAEGGRDGAWDSDGGWGWGGGGGAAWDSEALMVRARVRACGVAVDKQASMLVGGRMQMRDDLLRASKVLY